MIFIALRTKLCSTVCLLQVITVLVAAAAGLAALILLCCGVLGLYDRWAGVEYVEREPQPRPAHQRRDTNR